MPSFNFHSTGNEVVDTFRDQVKDKIILITGASVNGLGAETALSLARAHPARLLLLARSSEKVRPVIHALHKINAEIEVDFISIELDKASSIRAAAKEINTMVPRIDIFINNAGIMAVPYKKNDAGIESQLATNHIGHFLLTNLLMDKVRGVEKETRIVNLTSDGYLISAFNFDDYNFSDGKTYDEFSGYGQSKTANILFTKYLAKHLHDVGVFAVHPGVIQGTSLSQGMADISLFESIPAIAERNTGHKFEMGGFKTIQEGVSTTLVAALDPRLSTQSGSLLFDCNIVIPKQYASSEENAEMLWKLSEHLVGQEFKL